MSPNQKGEKMRKTTYAFNWEQGYCETRRLSRSFKTLAEAERFAEGKNVTDIYRSKGLYKVEWTKLTENI